jgi:signal recognition particle subunit SEC65
MTVALADQIASVRREIRFREYVYPRRVATGRMSVEDARRETERMKAVLATLEEVQQKERLL